MMSKKQSTMPPKCTLRPLPDPFLLQELGNFSLGPSKQEAQAKSPQFKNQKMICCDHQRQFEKSESEKYGTKEEDVKILGECE